MICSKCRCKNSSWLNTKKSWYVTQIKELVMPVSGLIQILFHASRKQQIIQFSLKGVINSLKDFLELHSILMKKQGNNASVKHILNAGRIDFYFFFKLVINHY